MSKKVFIQCDCHHGGLFLEFDEFGLNISHLEVSPSKRTLKHKISHALACLRDKPYTDMVILNEDSIEELYLFIKDIRSKKKKKQT